MKNADAPGHVRGESLFIDDLPTPHDLLHAAVFTSPVARGRGSWRCGALARLPPGA